MEYTEWPCPAPGGGTREEMALTFDRKRAARLLVLPAWFDEANKLRRQTVSVMRKLHENGVDCFLPDLPGCNESLSPIAEQTLGGWRESAKAAAVHFGANHIITVRAGALLAPEGLPGWSHAPTGGRQILRGLIRARTIAGREFGRSDTSEDLQQVARREGIELAGWQIGADMFRDLETAEPANNLTEIEQSALGGGALWLRAEPDEDADQAAALAAILVAGMHAA